MADCIESATLWARSECDDSAPSSAGVVPCPSAVTREVSAEGVAAGFGYAFEKAAKSARAKASTPWRAA